MRTLTKVALVALLALACLAAALIAFPGPALRLALRAADVEPVAFENLRLGAHALELDGLALGAPPRHRLQRLRIEYRWPDLLAGHLKSVEIDGLSLSGRLEGGRLRLAGFEPEGGEGGGGPEPEGGEGGAGIALLPRPERVVLRDARIELETAWGRLVLPLSADLRTALKKAEFVVRLQDARLEGASATLRAEGSLQGALPLDIPFALDRITANGRLRVASAGAQISDLARDAALHGTVALGLDHGILSAASRDLVVEIEALGPALDAVGAPLPPPWRLAAGSDDEAIRLVGEATPDGAKLQASGPLRLTAATAEASATLDAALELDRAGGLRRLAPSRATLSAKGLRWPALDLASVWLEISAEGAPAALNAKASLEVSGSGAGEVVEVAGFELQDTLSATFDGQRLVLAAAEPGSLAFDGIAWRKRLEAGPFGLRLDRADAPLLTLALDEGRVRAWQASLAGATLAPSSARVLGFDPPLDLELALSQISIAAVGDGGNLGRAEIELSGGRASASSPPLEASGIGATVTIEGGGSPRVSLDAEQLTSTAEPAWLTPMRLSATLRPGDVGLEFEGRLVRVAGDAELRFEGAHDPATGTGRIALRMPPVEFVPGRLQPGGLVPAMAGMLARASGRIEAEGDLSWRPNRPLATSLDLLLDGLSFSAGLARFQQVDGVVTLNRLWPPSTPPDQKIAVAVLNIGLPLTNGMIDFQLHPDGALEVGQLRWRVAGGTVRAEPFRVDSEVSAFDVTLKAEGLSLDRLLALTELQGLSGEGRISGELPVRVQGSEATVRGGELSSDGPGTLRYRPIAPPSALQAGGAKISLLLQALENFRYDELRITLDGRTDAEMDARLHLRGANPDLYGGHPVEFNLNLEGELANIVRNSLAGYQIPEQIRERIQ
ncbi:MAG: intermembrane phospholipid transport protein YdbH family protein, partial [Geminicoccaceae bacterium]